MSLNHDFLKEAALLEFILTPESLLLTLAGLGLTGLSLSASVLENFC